MQLARVVGTTTSTVKHPTLQGWKMLVVQLLQADGKSPDGEPVISIDTLGAGPGELVLITSDGSGTQELMKSKNTPVRWSTLGIVDE